MNELTYALQDLAATAQLIMLGAAAVAAVVIVAMAVMK